MARSVPKCKRAAYVYDRDFIVVDDISGVLKMRSECAIDGYGFLSSQGDYRNPQEIPPIIREQMAAWPDPRPIGSPVFTPSPDYQYFLFNYTVTDIADDSSTFDATATIGLNYPVASMDWSIDGIYAGTGRIVILMMIAGIHNISVVVTDTFGNQQSFAIVYEQPVSGKVLELLFNGDNGSTIIDSTGRHIPSLSSGGIRTIAGNRLQVGGGGFIRADAANTINQDFNFINKDFSISFNMQPTAGGTAWVFKKTSQDAAGGGSPYLVFIGSTQLAFRSYNNQDIVTYTSPSTLIGINTKVEINRTGTTFKMLINDVVVDTKTYTESQRGIDFSSQNYGMIVGASPPDGGLTGYIDNFIVYKYN